MRDTIPFEEGQERNALLLGFAATQQNPAAQVRETLMPVRPDRIDNPQAIVMVDAAADITRSMLKHPRMRVLPLEIELSSKSSLTDKGNRQKPSTFRELTPEQLRYTNVVAPSPSEVEYRLYPNIAVNADWILYIGSSSVFLDAFESIRVMLEVHDSEIREMRRERDLDESLKLVYIDSASILTGPALLARQVMHLLDRKEPTNMAASIAHRLVPKVSHWMVPRIPADFRDRLERLGRARVRPWISGISEGLSTFSMRRYPILSSHGETLQCEGRETTWRKAFNTMLAKAEEALQSEVGGRVARMQFSIDGSITEAKTWPEFDRFSKLAEEAGVSLHLTHMSLAGKTLATAGSASLALVRETD